MRGSVAFILSSPRYQVSFLQSDIPRWCRASQSVKLVKADSRSRRDELRNPPVSNARRWPYALSVDYTTGPIPGTFHKQPAASQETQDPHVWRAFASARPATGPREDVGGCALKSQVEDDHHLRTLRASAALEPTGVGDISLSIDRTPTVLWPTVSAGGHKDRSRIKTGLRSLFVRID